METNSVFATLNAINCNEHTEKKGQLTYLSWAWAWQMVKQNYPLATYTIYETPEGRPYFDDGKTAWVKTGVTIDGIEHIEYLPIMDYNNRSIALDKIVSTDVNKTIQRSLTKACARHGLGLYIYAGEDLPDTPQTTEVAPEPKKAPAKPKKKAEDIAPAEEFLEPHEARTLAEAVKLATNATSADELVEIWTANRAKFGTETGFVMAISNNPNNPKKR